MMHVRRLVALLVLSLPVAFAWAADEDWRVDKDQDGIQVSTRAVEGWSIREIRAVTHLKTRLSSVVAVLDDIGAMPELHELVKMAEIAKRESDTRYQTYSIADMPWPLSDRDAYNQREIVQDPGSLAVTLTDKALDGVKPPQKDLVRVVKSTQTWVMTPAADGTVTVEMRMLSDPNGPIPASVINSLSVSAPFKTMTKLTAMVQQPKYAQARLAFIREPGGTS